jgi:phosphoglycolate phosphatase-like HAD superfamily hydrolase
VDTRSVTGRLAGIDLVVLDKDGTLIDFHAMWSGWAEDLADRLSTATGRDLQDELFAMLGYDPVTGRAVTGGRLVATPMARLRDLTGALLRACGIDSATARVALDAAWHAPDPVALARPVTDLPTLLASIRAGGCRVAVATTDDRDPTERTIEALGIASLVDDVVCADDGVATKPAPDMLRHLGTRLCVPPGRTAVVGDSVADLVMGRAAGAARCYGVLTGVGTFEDLAPLADEVLGSVADLVDR